MGDPKQNDDAFLRDLQKQCLTDGLEHVSRLREGLPAIQGGPARALAGMLKHCHTLKGNLQAAGFAHCGAYLHAIEEILVRCERELKETGAGLIESELHFFEFLLSDAFQNVEFYVRDLIEKGQDSEEMSKRRIALLDVLERWRPDASRVSAVVSTVPPPVLVPEPVVVEPVKVHEVPEAPVSVEPKRVEQQPEAVIGKDLYLICKNGARHFGVPINSIVEIVEAGVLNPLPCDRPDLMGLINLRGEVMPVVNLVSAIGHTDSSKHYIIVCNVKDSQFGFLIEDAQQVIELDRASFQSAEKLVMGCGSDCASRVVRHVSLLDDKTVLILDLSGALAA